MAIFKKSGAGYEVTENYGGLMRVVGFVQNFPTRVLPWHASNKTDSQSFSSRKAAGNWLAAIYKRANPHQWSNL